MKSYINFRTVLEQQQQCLAWNIQYLEQQSLDAARYFRKLANLLDRQTTSEAELSEQLRVEERQKHSRTIGRAGVNNE
jgi:hypothetical protein